jgi:hypothetical protein
MGIACEIVSQIGTLRKLGLNPMRPLDKPYGVVKLNILALAGRSGNRIAPYYFAGECLLLGTKRAAVRRMTEFQ